MSIVVLSVLLLMCVTGLRMKFEDGVELGELRGCMPGFWKVGIGGVE